VTGLSKEGLYSQTEPRALRGPNVSVFVLRDDRNIAQHPDNECLPRRVNRIIARETGQSFEKVVADTERNFWVGAEEAVAYGLVSRVVKSASEV
jgi:hypothetical protein